MDLGLNTKVALVCASSKGLGRAAAEGLAREGARVALWARNEEPLLQAAAQIHTKTGSETLPIVADVTKEDDVARMVRLVIEKWGTIHILVTNAGGPPAAFSRLMICRPGKPPWSSIC
jgi:3-oxoacyl-[acyl-carrier protein] reductase